MAVITELIEAGLRLKRGGNLGGAIEHFKQLRATYDGHPRIMFELAACWRAFGVPERALPLYRDLLAMPQGKGLPPKDKPRLYTQLGATLLELGDQVGARAIIEEGLRLHPGYRSLRAWRIFALAQAGDSQRALLDALELMLESLAPSRWDIFEAEVKATVAAMRENLPDQDIVVEAPTADNSEAPSAEQPADNSARAIADQREIASGERPHRSGKINIASDDQDAAETEVAVNLVKPTRKKKSRRDKHPRPQMGKKAVRIDISGESEAPEEEPDDDEGADPEGSLKIPIDFD